MTDALMVQLAGVVITPIVVAYFANRTTVQVAKLNIQAKDAAVQVAEVKSRLDTQGDAARMRSVAVAANVAEVKRDLAESTSVQGAKLDKIGVTTEASHGFANARYGVLLRDLLGMAQYAAKLSGKPADAAAAERAQKALDDHQAAQGVVDAQPGAVA